jgi:hypothetical protein
MLTSIILTRIKNEDMFFWSGLLINVGFYLFGKLYIDGRIISDKKNILIKSLPIEEKKYLIYNYIYKFCEIFSLTSILFLGTKIANFVLIDDNNIYVNISTLVMATMFILNGYILVRFVVDLDFIVKRNSNINFFQVVLITVGDLLYVSIFNFILFGYILIQLTFIDIPFTNSNFLNLLGLLLVVLLTNFTVGYKLFTGKFKMKKKEFISYTAGIFIIITLWFGGQSLAEIFKIEENINIKFVNDDRIKYSNFIYMGFYSDLDRILDVMLIKDSNNNKIYLNFIEGVSELNGRSSDVLEIKENGKTSKEGLTWTKGYFIDNDLKVKNKYHIYEKDDKKYLIVEAKTKSNLYDHTSPHYEVYIDMSR